MTTSTKSAISFFNNQLLCIFSSEILIWDIKQNILLRKVVLPEQINILYTQIITRKKYLFLIDQINSKMLYLDANLVPKTVVIPKIAAPQACYVININENEIVFHGALQSYLFNKNDLSFNKYSYMLVAKHNRHFGSIKSEVFNLDHNILYTTENCERILYHNYYANFDWEDLDINKETRKSEIGIYITEEEKKLPQFTSPEKITCVNWYTESNKWGDDYGPKTFSNIRGCLAGDKIVLCYHDMLYVLDYQGNVLQQRPPGEGLKYWDMTKMDEAHVIIAEASDGDTMSMSIYEV